MWCGDVDWFDLDLDRDEILDYADVNFSVFLINHWTSKESGFGGLAPCIIFSDEILVSAPPVAGLVA